MTSKIQAFFRSFFFSSRLNTESQIKVEDDTNQNHDHDLFKDAPADVLLEIFTRLPDCRSAVQSSTVCRLWHSSILGNPRFIPEFKSHHRRHPNRRPYSVVFRKGAIADKFFPDPDYFQPVFHLHSDDWAFLNGPTTTSNHLDFLPSPKAIIRASCNDLLLVSSGSRWTDDHYVCNPITKQFARLPSIPSRGVSAPKEREAVGYSLLRAPSSSARFEAVVFVLPDQPLPPEPFVVEVFSSESRKWERRIFHYPGPWTMCYGFNLITVECNGVLYWLEHERISDRIVYLDLSEKNRCGVIPFPPFDKDDNKHHVVGVVSLPRPELRLIRVFNMSMEGPLLLRVWRLDQSNNDMVRVHSVELEMPKGFRRRETFVDAYVHPTDGDSVFLVWGRYVVEYDLVNGKYGKIKDLGKTVQTMHMIRPFPVVDSYGDSDFLDKAEF